MFNKLLSSSIAIAALLLLIAGCSDGTDVSNRAKQPIEPDPQPVKATSARQQAPQTGAPSAKSGIVKSAHVAGGYSYLETEINGQIHWIATAATAVNPGQRIAWNDHAAMRNFTSKSLNRTFDQILFVDRISTDANMASNQHSGTVLESMNASGYSYIHVEEQGKRVWLAAPQMIIEVGQQIRWNSGSAMRNFTSSSLNRTFDEIFFVGGVDITSG